MRLGQNFWVSSIISKYRNIGVISSKTRGLLLWWLHCWSLICLFNLVVIIANLFITASMVLCRSLCAMFERTRNERNSQNPRSIYHRKKLHVYEQGVNIVGLIFGINYHCLVSYPKTYKSFQKSLTTVTVYHACHVPFGVKRLSFPQCLFWI